jgi:hypothetical protein
MKSELKVENVRKPFLSHFLDASLNGAKVLLCSPWKGSVVSSPPTV